MKVGDSVPGLMKAFTSFRRMNCCFTLNAERRAKTDLN